MESNRKPTKTEYFLDGKVYLTYKIKKGSSVCFHL